MKDVKWGYKVVMWDKYTKHHYSIISPKKLPYRIGGWTLRPEGFGPEDSVLFGPLGVFDSLETALAWIHSGNFGRCFFQTNPLCDVQVLPCLYIESRDNKFWNLDGDMPRVEYCKLEGVRFANAVKLGIDFLYEETW